MRVSRVANTLVMCAVITSACSMTVIEGGAGSGDHPNLVGSWETVARQAPGRLTVSGWAGDLNAPGTPATVIVDVDGQQAMSLTADEARPDIPKVHPNLGTDHGFRGTATTRKQEVNVCVTAVYSGGLRLPFSCRKVNLR